MDEKYIYDNTISHIDLPIELKMKFIRVYIIINNYKSNGFGVVPNNILNFKTNIIISCVAEDCSMSGLKEGHYLSIYIPEIKITYQTWEQKTEFTHEDWAAIDEVLKILNIFFNTKTSKVNAR